VEAVTEFSYLGGKLNATGGSETARTRIGWVKCGELLKGSFRLERSKDHNTTELQRSNALICFTEHTLKRIENEALPRYATQKCERALKGKRFSLKMKGKVLLCCCMEFGSES